MNYFSSFRKKKPEDEDDELNQLNPEGENQDGEEQNDLQIENAIGLQDANDQEQDGMRDLRTPELGEGEELIDPNQDMNPDQ